ncbi:MAG: DUF4412 domain-containing protein [Gammaproteobacteria bacterium]|nr:DUF4412 domain-containing protein [Gammaproteobacteria bacterium]
MNRMTKTVLTTTLVTLSLAAGQAMADARLVYVQSDTGKTMSIITIKNGVVRMDDKDGDGWVLFDSGTETLTTVDPESRSYTVLDKAAMEKLGNTVSDAMKQMQAQLESMPAEQRAMMESMLKKQFGISDDKVETSATRNGKTREIAGHTCEEVVFRMGNQGETLLCVVPTEELGISAADADAVAAMYRTMSQFAAELGNSIGISYSLPDVGGMPVYSRDSSDDAADILKRVETGSQPAALFDIPAGYRQQQVDFD